MGLADGMVSGAAHSTANTVLPALQLIRAAKGMHRVSGAFVMEKGDERYIFADCAININPDEETLAEIGYQSALTAKMADIDPKVAFLSFSTKGSAEGPMVDKVHDAAAMFQKITQKSLVMVNYNLMPHLFLLLVKRRLQVQRLLVMQMSLFSQNFNQVTLPIRWFNVLVALLLLAQFYKDLLLQ